MLVNSKLRDRSLSQRTKQSRQVLRQLINEQDRQRKSFTIQSKDIDIQKLRLSEAITFLQKKVDKQKIQIKELHQYKCTFQAQKKLLTQQLKSQKSKNEKLQQKCQGYTKSSLQLKKKMNKLEKDIIQTTQKNEQLDSKVRRLRDLLRRKQEQIQKLQSKVSFKPSTQGQKKYDNKIQDLEMLKLSITGLKQKQHTLQQRLQIKCKILTKVQQKLHQKEQQCFLLEQTNKRLNQELKQIEFLYQEDKEQMAKMAEKIKSAFEEKESEIATLRAKTQRVKQNTNYQFKKKEQHVFMKEISIILKDHIYDKRKRQQIEKLIKTVIQQIQESWNRIIKNAIALR